MDRSGIQSVEIALSVLRVMAVAPGPMSLTEVAACCGMSRSKMHRYLHSMVAGGLVYQERRSGRYDLGQMAAQIGLAALYRMDVINRVSDDLERLVESTGLAAFLTVLGPSGPTIIRLQRGAGPDPLSLTLGAALPLLTCATGHVYLAFGPRHLIEPLLRADGDPRCPDARRIAEAVCDAGYAVGHDAFIRNVSAACVPILDWKNQCSAAVTVYGAREHFEADALRATAADLLSFCAGHSLTLD